EVVDADDLTPPCEQGPRHVETDESGSPGDQNRRRRHRVKSPFSHNPDVRIRALGRSLPGRQACCRIANQCYRFALGGLPAKRDRATTGVGEATERVMSEVMRPSRFDARAQPPPRMIYVVSEDWYFLSHCLTMARAARAAGFEIHVVANVTEEAEFIRAEDFTVHAIRFRRGKLALLRTIRN